MKIVRMDDETYKKFLEMKKSSEVNNRKIKKRRRLVITEEGYDMLNRMAITALLLFAFIFLTCYSTTKARMQGVKIEPRTGVTYGKNDYNPKFREVIDEMFSGRGK